MGFERIVKLFTLQFPDGKYDGLEVRMRSLSTDQFLEVTGLAAAVQADSISKSAGDVRKLIGMVAAAMKSWNLEDDGVPVPATEAGLLDQEFEFVFDIAIAWLDAIAAVPPPLPGSSPNGASQTEESLDLASFSSSPSS